MLALGSQSKREIIRTDRLLRVGGWDRAHGFAAISEAV